MTVRRSFSHIRSQHGCKPPGDALAAKGKIIKFGPSRSADEILSRWLNSSINDLYAFFATLGEGVVLVNLI